MILSAHQPAYLPWLGYLDKIARSDLFVYLDGVQFEKNSYINRNRIKTGQGVQWLTVPVLTRGHTASTMRDTRIDEAQPWRRKHLASIAQNYRRAPHFEYCYARLESLLALSHETLADLCWDQLLFWREEFGIGTRLVRQSDNPVPGNKSDLVLNLCLQHGAQGYLSGKLGRDYLQLDEFARRGVEVRFQEFQQPSYPQLWGAFEPGLSLVDYWMNCGPAALFEQGHKHVVQ